MKRRELETKDQMMYAEEPRQVTRSDNWDERRVVHAVSINAFIAISEISSFINFANCPHFFFVI